MLMSRCLHPAGVRIEGNSSTPQPVLIEATAGQVAGTPSSRFYDARCSARASAAQPPVLEERQAPLNLSWTRRWPWRVLGRPVDVLREACHVLEPGTQKGIFALNRLWNLDFHHNKEKQ